MERIPSIIHKMQERYSEGASASELLFLLEDMRRELLRAIVPFDQTKAPVSVWLPQGYVGPQTGTVKEPSGDGTQDKQVTIVSSEEKMELKSPFEETNNIQAFQSETVVILAKEEELAPKEKGIKENIAFSFMSVPKPPLITVIEPELEDELPELINELSQVKAIKVPMAEPILEKLEEVINDEVLHVSGVSGPIIQELIPLAAEPITIINDQPAIIHEPSRLVEETPVVVAVKTKQQEETINIPEREKESEPDKPVIFELDLSDMETEPIHRKWEPLKIPDGFLVGSGFKESLVAEKPRELHEILANRVLAKPQGNMTGETSVGVMDKISGGKITDLRKGFSINDRFRFINSLFRGDEAMFDRAIKTINNFDILPEARYWMQRELVIKLGWHDEDELVQHFHQLVMRRFL